MARGVFRLEIGQKIAVGTLTNPVFILMFDRVDTGLARGGVFVLVENAIGMACLNAALSNKDSVC